MPTLGIGVQIKYLFLNFCGVLVNVTRLFLIIGVKL